MTPSDFMDAHRRERFRVALEKLDRDAKPAADSGLPGRCACGKKTRPLVVLLEEIESLTFDFRRGCCFDGPDPVAPDPVAVDLYRSQMDLIAVETSGRCPACAARETLKLGRLARLSLVGCESDSNSDS